MQYSKRTHRGQGGFTLILIYFDYTSGEREYQSEKVSRQNKTMYFYIRLYFAFYKFLEVRIMHIIINMCMIRTSKNLSLA